MHFRAPTRSLLSTSLLSVFVLGLSCAHVRARPQEPAHVQELRFEDVLITGDLELEKLNDEELFAAGTSYFAAKDFLQAARYFSRLADFFPNSPHHRAAMYNAGLSFKELKHWDEAMFRFHELADPAKGLSDALDASFLKARCLYELGRHLEALEVLNTIGTRKDLAADKLIEARVQAGVCELEAGQTDAAEKTFRDVLTFWNEQPDRDLIGDAMPSQAQFFLGEIFRLHFEGVNLDPNKNTDQLAQDLEYKSELLLSAQGHYLRTIRMGNGYWATASGQRIGNLYESMYQHLVDAPAPNELNAAEQDLYKVELRRKIRVLITKAITVYERTLEAAERIGASSPFVEETKQSLQRMKDLLLAEAEHEAPVADPPAPPPPPPAGKKNKPRS